jgi:hypothetical protein
MSDPCEFSPLLATKTVDAAWRVGLLEVQLGHADAARAWWQRGVNECRRVLTADWRNTIGDAHSPQLFAFAELMHVVDAASRCGRALAVGALWTTSPAHALELSQQSPITDAKHAWNEASRLANAWLAQVSQTTAVQHDRDAGWQEAQRIASEWQRAIDAAAAHAHESRTAQAALTLDRDRWLREAKRLEAEWSAQVQRANDSANALEASLADARRIAQDRDVWHAEATRIASEWQSVANELRHAVAACEHSHARERELVQQLDAAKQHADATALAVQHEKERLERELLHERMHAAHQRGLFEALRGEADELERRTVFKIARNLGIIDPIYTGKTAPTTLDARPHATGGTHA